MFKNRSLAFVKSLLILMTLLVTTSPKANAQTFFRSYGDSITAGLGLPVEAHYPTLI